MDEEGSILRIKNLCWGTYQPNFGYLMLCEEEDHPSLEWQMGPIWALKFPLTAKLFLCLYLAGKVPVWDHLIKL